MADPRPAPMRLRCAAELFETAHGEAQYPARHLALDVRLPVTVDALVALGTALATCPCGGRMLIAQDAAPVEPPTRPEAEHG